MKLTCRVSTKLSSSKPQILLDSTQRRMKDKDNLMIKGKEMMSCCLTKETHQTAQDSLPTKSETGELEAGEQSIPRTTTFIA